MTNTSGFLIVQLELCPPPDSDPFAQSCLYNLDLVYIEKDTDLVKSLEFE